ncbi:MAG: DegV family protein [Eggerthellaceae bacterium]|nr:DegV family protein [Eggerthellaceae bacterium]
MGKIILSADSTCDLGDELKAQCRVHYYPYHIEFRGHSYLDNVDITPEVLYAGYYEDGSLPKTSAINVQEYVDYFRSLLEEGDEVIHLNLGGALSSSYDHACLAAREVPGVHVVDSCNLSTGTGQLVIRAARMIEEGMEATDIVAALEALKPRVHASFVLDALEFMAAGGRCPQILSHVGKTLHLRPEIVVDNADGSMHVGRLHHGSMHKALKEYVRDQVKKNPGILTDDVFVTHSGAIAPELIDEVCDNVRELLPDVERIHVTQASCTISCHCGPGTIGILFVTED